MRPGQNKRMRGRNNNNNNNNRRGPNPLTRSYESNGPDVKIRGTAHHIGEKYLQLARDAQSSGDPVMAESYLQHAEHYFRLIASAQLAQQQAQFGYQRQPGEQVEQDEDGDDDFDSLPDRFASPSERVAQAPPPQPQPQAQPQPYEPRGERPYNDRQSFEPRHGQNGHFHDRSQQGDRHQDNRQQDNRPRQPFVDRNVQQQDRGQDRQERTNQERNNQDRQAQGQGDRQNRDYDNRNFRNRRDDRARDGQPREFRDQPREVREPRQPVPDEQPSVGLPAFITAPTRVPLADAAEADQPMIAQPANAQTESPATAPEATDEAGFHMRPRRRRRPKPELADAGTGSVEGASPAPVVEDSDG